MAESPAHMRPDWKGGDLAYDEPEGLIETGSVVPYRSLVVSYGIFRCPYCGRSWNRGGHKEGFVKAAAMNHVAMCHEILLWHAGYVMTRWEKVRPIDTADSRTRRRVMAAIAKRRRDGWMPTAPQNTAGGTDVE